MRKYKEFNTWKGDNQKYVVHPILGVTSTKRCHIPVTFISFLRKSGLQLQLKSCHQILLILTGFSPGVFFRNSICIGQYTSASLWSKKHWPKSHILRYHYKSYLICVGGGFIVPYISASLIASPSNEFRIKTFVCINLFILGKVKHHCLNKDTKTH